MDLAENGNTIEAPAIPTRSYRSLTLTDRILESAGTSNFKDRYILGEQLGWGQFGIIRECSDKLTGEVLACKSISKDRLITQDDVRSIKLEIEILTRLCGHPNIVDLKAVYEEDDHVHLLMELCAGGELFHLVEKIGRFAEHDARVIFRQLMEVVMYCHDKGIVHRDLKPENILLVSKSPSSSIKLADFGLATYIKPGQRLHGIVGSPFYIAPEVLAGGYNHAADVWSAGVILYILLSGMPPFWGKTKSKIFDAVRSADLRFPVDHWEHISASAKDLVMGMLRVDPAKRFSAAEVLAHPWMNDPVLDTQRLHSTQSNLSCQQLEADGCNSSEPFISRNQDYSFTDGSPATAESAGVISPVYTCRSSFSSFLLLSAPCSVAGGGFSFSSCCESSAPEFSSPISSLPSFTFFSPSPAVEKRSELHFQVKLSIADEESRFREVLLLPESQVIEHKSGEVEHRTEFHRGGGISGSKISSMHSKRNHTIGHCELDQIELTVTESVIRWASCTNISSSASLRSSLVC